jgi:hypothetical protein
MVREIKPRKINYQNQRQDGHGEDTEGGEGINEVRK